MLLSIAAAFGGMAAAVTAETTEMPWWASVLVGFVVPICVLVFNMTVEMLHHFGKISDSTYRFLGGFVKDLQDDGKLNGSNKESQTKKDNDQNNEKKN